MDISQFIIRTGDVAKLIIPVRKYFKTDGKGHWSKIAKKIYVRSIEMEIGLKKDEYEYYDGSSDLRVYFSKSSWDINTHGLIYTDETFMTYVRQFLFGLGFDAAAVNDVVYSEQGMQAVSQVPLLDVDVWIQTVMNGRFEPPEGHVSCDAYMLEQRVRDFIIQKSE
jgi:hypothetical protein